MGLFGRGQGKSLAQIPPPPAYAPEGEAPQEVPPAFVPHDEPTSAPEAPHPDPLHIPDIRFDHAPEHEEAPVPAELTIPQPPSLVHDTPAPLFVSVSDYQTILDGIEKIKITLGETEGHIAKILDLKARQEQLVEDWKAHIDDIQKKLNYVDEVIFKAR